VVDDPHATCGFSITNDLSGPLHTNEVTCETSERDTVRNLDRILQAVFAASAASDGAATLDMQHMVMTTDPYTGDTMFIGPFDDPVAACVFAERHGVALVDDEFPEPIRCRVVPLLPPAA
jgi:hypothetical protein